MGKSLDQLTDLSDAPLTSPSPPSGDDRDTVWYRFLAEIDDLLATGHYSWAEDTLTSIHTTVELRRTVSEGQRRAVDNITRSRSRERGSGGRSRRYEGWG